MVGMFDTLDSVGMFNIVEVFEMFDSFRFVMLMCFVFTMFICSLVVCLIVWKCVETFAVFVLYGFLIYFVAYLYLQYVC